MVIYGKNTVMEAINTGKEISKLYLTKQNFESIKKNILPKTKIEILTLKEMDDKFKGNHQGFVAIVEEYQYADLDETIALLKKKDNAAIAILDSLEDPHNLGAILRSADATGIDAIIIPKNHSVSLNSTVAKVSTGAIEHVKTIQVSNLVYAMKKLKEAGYWISGLDMNGEIDYRNHDYKGKIAVVIGNEGKGISRLVKEECDFLVNIPMIGHVNSLNASVSAAIIFYEILRNRG